MEDTIASETSSWLACQSQDELFLRPQPDDDLSEIMDMNPERCVGTRLANQVGVVQQALRLARAETAWPREFNTGSKALSSRASSGFVASDPPVEDLEVEGHGLLDKPDFVMLQGGACKTFVAVKAP